VPSRSRLAILLAAALVTGAAIALTLSSAAAGPSGGISRLFLPLVVISDTQAPTPTTAPTQTPTAAATQQPANCDHSYPTICVPYPPPDLDCPDIPYRNFQVVAPDDHHFDADHDGIGCEQNS
jgi:hypothetical protein